VIAAGAGAACVAVFFFGTRLFFSYYPVPSHASAPAETSPVPPPLPPIKAPIDPSPSAAAPVRTDVQQSVMPVVQQEPKQPAPATKTRSKPEAAPSVPLSEEEKAWKKTQSSGDLKSYLSFLRTYPTSPSAPLAQTKIDELGEQAMWESTRESVEAKVWENFLAAYPDSKQAPTVRDKLTRFRAEQMAWDAIQDSSDPKAFRDFLKAYPDGRFAAQAKQRAIR
jgi:hypothetical protein